MSLQADFERAQVAAKGLAERPDNATLLRLYALYKQGSVGDVQGKRPGMLDFVGRAKWDAWSSLTGTAQDDAQQQYIELVSRLSDH